MALLIETRKQAEAGNKKARKSVKLINRYIADHPPSTMAGDEKREQESNPRAVAALWQARAQSPEKFASVVIQAAPFVNPWALTCAILHGPALNQDAPLMKTVNVKDSKIAACTRRAFVLRRLDDSRVPIRSYCKYTAMELGE